MSKTKESGERVLARNLGRELSDEELKVVSGGGCKMTYGENGNIVDFECRSKKALK